MHFWKNNFCGDRKLWRHQYLGNVFLRKMWYYGFWNCFTYWWFWDNKKWDYPSCQIVTVISLPNNDNNDEHKNNRHIFIEIIHSEKTETTWHEYALVIAEFRVQYGQYFLSFSYFAVVSYFLIYKSEIKAKYEKRVKY